MNTPPPKTALTAEERLEAIEYLIGQITMMLEVDSVGIHERLDRLEAAISKAAPNMLTAAQDDEPNDPFTIDSLGQWMQICVERMRAHQSVSPRQIAAIGEVTMRVLDLGESLTPKEPPAIGQDAIAVLEKAKRQRRAD